MNTHRTYTLLGAAILIGLGAAGGYWLALSTGEHAADMSAMQPAAADKKVLYWYDPMYPQQKFDKPGPSPFMDMALVPRHAQQEASGAAVRIDSAVAQNLGIRLAPVVRDTLDSTLGATANLNISDRDRAVLQAPEQAFIEKVYPLAEDDLIRAGEPIADLLIPEWVRAQEEFLALRSSGNRQLLAAARQRMRLIGMPAALIAAVERSGRTQTVWTLTSPINGVIKSLDVRRGMRLNAGQDLASISGLGTVWLDIDIAQGNATRVQPGQSLEARLSAFPGEVFSGKVKAILPETDTDSRTLRVRAELDNAQGRLRPGLTAQVRINTGAGRETLWIPTEALIRTGQRTLVMLAVGEGAYQGVEVRTGLEAGDRSEILAGLQAGQNVVVSGQFLLDSEASLQGVEIRRLSDSAATENATTAKPLHASQGEVIEVSANAITVAHGPFETLGMPGMTMSFKLAKAELADGIEVGEHVRFAVSEADAGLIVEQLQTMEAQP